MSLLIEKYDNPAFKKTTTLINPSRPFPTERFDGYFFTIKNPLRAGDYAATACAHKIHTIKTRPNNPLRYFNARTVSVDLANDLICAAHKTTFGTRKRFHNKQYTSKSKDQPLESERTHFDIEFNNSSIAMHRPTIIFLLSHKITTVQ